MSRERISTPLAPAAIGPYSQAIRFSGNLCYTAGQVALDPATGNLVSGGIAEQTAQVMRNLDAILRAAGTSFANVVKTVVFLKDFNDFAAMNEVYARHFPDAPPARSTVEVSRLPKDALVEIECLAVLP